MGSSPLARGPPNRRGLPSKPTGLIPARAGTTVSQRAGTQYVRAHPRSRGDHLATFLIGCGITGSSPLARGPLLLIRIPACRCGLIPARAGTTFLGGGHDGIGGAHPRSRGDHGAWIFGVAIILGSSPLARGPPDSLFGCAGFGGLIPARAGTTRQGLAVPQLVRAHPRSRGDHCIRSWCGSYFLGSSPLARGPQEDGTKGYSLDGLIPARAGTTRMGTRP